MTKHAQHNCPGCGEATMGFAGAPPLSRCRACGKSFMLSDFSLEKDKPAPPTLEELLIAVETSVDLDNCGPFAFDKNMFVLVSALVGRVRRLEEANEGLRDSVRSHAQNIKRLKGIP